MKSELSAPHFHIEDAAFAYVEARMWPDGKPICPKCGVVGQAGRLRGKSVRPGLWKCYACRKQFTVRVGTIFESSHAPLHIWLQAFHLMCSSKKGISTRQLQRTFGGSMKTAWFLGHRIREAMKEAHQFFDEPLGGPWRVVESDETYIGRKAESRAYRAAGSQAVRRGFGAARRSRAQLPRSECNRRQPSAHHRQARPRRQPLHDRHQHGIRQPWVPFQGSAPDYQP